MEKNKDKNSTCKDRLCPFHGQLSVRGRYFQGKVIKIFPKRAVIEFERMVRIPKYERYLKTKTKIHARLAECMQDINLGDYIEVGGTRPLSKIIHFVVIKKIIKENTGDKK